MNVKENLTDREGKAAEGQQLRASLRLIERLMLTLPPEPEPGSVPPRFDAEWSTDKNSCLRVVGMTIQKWPPDRAAEIERTR